VRRLGPRPFGPALERVLHATTPATTLAAVQRHWPATAGARVAAEAEPIRERDGEVTVACRSAVWANELDLLASDLVNRLNEALDSASGRRPVRRLRFVTRSDPSPR
jgi:predicted nucleic acid-binding Zn ribbon protein